MHRNPNCSCNYCGEQIYRRPNQIKNGLVFCSRTCTGKYSRKDEKSCPICNKIIFGKSKTCSRTCSNKSRYGIKYDGLNKKNNANKSKVLRENLSKIRGGICEECGNENYKGITRPLFDSVEEYAKNNNCEYILLEAYGKWRKDYYKTFGYQNIIDDNFPSMIKFIE